MSNRYTNKKIKELEKEIKILNKSRDFLAQINETLYEKYDEADWQRKNYRKIIKFQALLFVVMNLLCNTEGYDDITRIIKCNIMDYYKKITMDLMEIKTKDDEEFDDEDKGTDLWDVEEEFS